MTCVLAVFSRVERASCRTLVLGSIFGPQVTAGWPRGFAWISSCCTPIHLLHKWLATDCSVFRDLRVTLKKGGRVLVRGVGR